MIKPHPYYINSSKINTPLFVELSNQKHNNKFDYSKVTNANFHLLNVICPIHGEISLSATEHFDVGCELCIIDSIRQEKKKVQINLKGEYQTNGIIKTNLNLKTFSDISTLYFVKFTHQISDEMFFKVGITRLNIKARFKYGYDNWIIQEIDSFHYNRNHIHALERIIISENKNIKYTPKIRFGGWTECFKNYIDIKTYFFE